MSKPQIKIGVISDVVCPWCYIGKRRLEKALDLTRDRYDFDVEYFPFELNPSVPPEGFDQKQYLSEKFGGEAQYERITAHVTHIAKTEGLDFHFERQTIVPNTRNAHRLIWFAKTKGKHHDVVEALFHAYFTDGTNLSQRENLIRIAEKAGLDISEAESFLAGSEGNVEIEATETEIHRMGISGVPFYIINNTYGLSGAQPPETFTRVFDEVNAATINQ